MLDRRGKSFSGALDQVNCQFAQLYGNKTTVFFFDEPFLTEEIS